MEKENEGDAEFGPRRCRGGRERNKYDAKISYVLVNNITQTAPIAKS